MPSDVEIANGALSKLGSTRITSLTDSGEVARKVNAIYSLKRDELLGLHHWRFSLKRAKLAKLATAPLFEWSAAFQLPPDYIVLHKVNGDEIERVPHSVEGDQLLLVQDSADIVYVARITDPQKFPPWFSMAFENFLAAELSFALSQNETNASNIRNTFAAVLGHAKALDSASAGDLRRQRESNVILARRSRRGV